jgi:FLVCR family MFS transporter 7
MNIAEFDDVYLKPLLKGIGMFNTLYTLMQQLLCPSGYTNLFSGFTSALLITGGVVGATGASNTQIQTQINSINSLGIVVDRTKLYEETMKVSMAVAVVFGLLFLQVLLKFKHVNSSALCLLSLFSIVNLKSSF